MDKETLPPEAWDEHFRFALHAYYEDPDTGSLWPKLLRHLAGAYPRAELQNEVFVSLTLALKSCAEHCEAIRQKGWVLTEGNEERLHPAIIRAFYEHYALGDVYARIENPRITFECLEKTAREHCPPEAVPP